MKKSNRLTTGMAAEQEISQKPLRNELQGSQPWKGKIKRLNKSLTHANSIGGKQYLEGFIEGQLQSGPVVEVEQEVINKMNRLELIKALSRRK